MSNDDDTARYRTSLHTRFKDPANLPVHLKRVSAKIHVGPHVRLTREIEEGHASQAEQEDLNFEAHLILNDFSKKGVGFYCPIFVQPGRSIDIKLDEPIPAELKGVVLWCHERLKGTHIITQQKNVFRVGVAFTFIDEMAQKEVDGLYQKILVEQVLNKLKVA